MAITISFACNDPENGNFTGRFDKMTVDAGDLHIEFETSEYPSRGSHIDFDFPVFAGYGEVRLGRLELVGLAFHRWHGNWCWDAVKVAWPDALAIINCLGEAKAWRIVDGPGDLFEAFNDRREITPMEWKANNEARRKA